MQYIFIIFKLVSAAESHTCEGWRVLAETTYKILKLIFDTHINQLCRTVMYLRGEERERLDRESRGRSRAKISSTIAMRGG